MSAGVTSSHQVRRSCGSTADHASTATNTTSHAAGLTQPKDSGDPLRSVALCRTRRNARQSSTSPPWTSRGGWKPGVGPATSG